MEIVKLLLFIRVFALISILFISVVYFVPWKLFPWLTYETPCAVCDNATKRKGLYRIYMILYWLILLIPSIIVLILTFVSLKKIKK